MFKNKNCTIYWAPAFVSDQDWNMLYSDPVSLFDTIRPLKTNSDNGSNFFYCPAFGNFTKNTFVLKNPMAASFNLVQDNKLKVESQTKNHVFAHATRPPSITGCSILEYGLSWIFFSEDDVEISLTSPYFEKVSPLKYGNIIPGRFNISKWFRTLNLEYNLYDGVTEFCAEKDESLAYVSFNTTKPVKLVRFEMNKKLHQYAESVGTSSDWESWIPLMDRYSRFIKTKTNKLVLNEIKKNLVDTDTD